MFLNEQSDLLNSKFLKKIIHQNHDYLSRCRKGILHNSLFIKILSKQNEGNFSN